MTSSAQTFPLTGMTCGNCVSKVTARLLDHPEIATASVTLDPPEARITPRSVPLTSDTLNAWLQPLGKYHISDAATATSTNTPSHHSEDPPKNAQTYKPLIILLGYLLAVVAAATTSHGVFDLGLAMRLFMGGFFIAFSFFKMLDLRGFADAYRSYDIVAKPVPAYGFIYPFIELALGLGYLAGWQPAWINAATGLVMAVSLIGVLRSVLSKRAIRCACLGTVFNLPMSTVTIIEDALMLAMALMSFFIPHA